MAEIIRTYDALVALNDPSIIEEYVGGVFSEEEVITLPLRYLGMDVADSLNALSTHHPFKGRREPKLEPQLGTLMWCSTDTSRISLDMGGPQSHHAWEELRVTNGTVTVDAIRLRGRNHSQFNRFFRNGAEVAVDHVVLYPDRRAAKQEDVYPKRRSVSVLPLLGRVQLLRFSLNVD